MVAYREPSRPRRRRVIRQVLLLLKMVFLGPHAHPIFFLLELGEQIADVLRNLVEAPAPTISAARRTWASARSQRSSWSGGRCWAWSRNQSAFQ